MHSPPFPRYLVSPRSKYSPQHHILKHPQLIHTKVWKVFPDVSILEDEIGISYRNLGKYLPSDVSLYPRRAKTSATELQKFKNSITTSLSLFTFRRFNKNSLNFKLFNIKYACLFWAFFDSKFRHMATSFIYFFLFSFLSTWLEGISLAVSLSLCRAFTQLGAVYGDIFPFVSRIETEYCPWELLHGTSVLQPVLTSMFLG